MSKHSAVMRLLSVLSLNQSDIGRINSPYQQYVGKVMQLLLKLNISIGAYFTHPSVHFFVKFTLANNISCLVFLS